MKLHKVLTLTGLARSGSEAQRLIKQGAVSYGGCEQTCSFFETGKCTCGGWTKTTNPTEEVEVGIVVKVGRGAWRLEKRLDGTSGFDQLNGVAKVPAESPTPATEQIPHRNQERFLNC